MSYGSCRIAVTYNKNLIRVDMVMKNTTLTFHHAGFFTLCLSPGQAFLLRSSQTR